VLPLSGFFSKDEILYYLLKDATYSGYWLAFAGGIVVSVLTAFYVFKSWFRVFFGNVCNLKAHEGSPMELVPVSILATLTIFVGFLVIPLGTFLGSPGHWPSLMMVGISTGAMLTGAISGFLVYSQRHRMDNYSGNLRVFVTAAQRRFYLDAFYEVFFIRPYFLIANFLWWLDAKILDNVVNGVSWLYIKATPLVYWFDANVIDGFVNAASWVYIRKTRVARIIDERIVDGIVNGAAWNFIMLARTSRIIDKRIIDGAVNALGSVSVLVGKSFRTVQDGRIQWYQRLIIGAAVFILGMFVIVYVFALKGA
jgi:NADH:ubiquinone oxidoreductase subunit 5 (subunit L)/multisubunit Na+/H+ antiporter MnhA subunit